MALRVPTAEDLEATPPTWVVDALIRASVLTADVRDGTWVRVFRTRKRTPVRWSLACMRCDDDGRDVFLAGFTASRKVKKITKTGKARYRVVETQYSVGVCGTCKTPHWAERIPPVGSSSE